MLGVPVECLVWDMDGTLVDSTQVVPHAFMQTVRELGRPELDAAAVVAAYSLGPPEVILPHLLGRDLADGEVEAYYGRLDGAVLAPYGGIREVLESLRMAGHPVVVFTGASTRAARTLLAAAGLEVDLLLGGDQVERPKPAPDGLELASRRLRLPVARLAYIGDAPTDLRTARAAGARAVAAGWGHLYDPAEPADATLASPGEALGLLAT